MMKTGQRGDFNMPEVTLENLENNLDMMGGMYAEVHGVDAFHDLEDYCKDIIVAVGNEIDKLDILQRLFVMCYFACSWTSSYVVSMNKTNDMVKKFINANIDLPLYEAVEKFFEIFGGEAHE